MQSVYAWDLGSYIGLTQQWNVAAMLLYQTNHVEAELFSYVNTLFCFNKFAWLLATSVGTL